MLASPRSSPTWSRWSTTSICAATSCWTLTCVDAALECAEPYAGIATWSAPATNTLTVDVMVCAVGLFGSLKLPDIAGLADFAGMLMHTAQWDHRVDLAGKKVAVIGTGASGVQVVPELANIAERVTVFQRTPPWMVPKDDRPYSATELARFRRIRWRCRGPAGRSGSFSTTTPRPSPTTRLLPRVASSRRRSWNARCPMSDFG